jgi:NAD(P)-dependent dehydrogenase (short-subunit alcohol dehydrogenase family)
MLPLAGKTMVVIGGSRGVGRQIVASWYPRWRALAVALRERPQTRMRMKGQ